MTAEHDPLETLRREHIRRALDRLDEAPARAGKGNNEA